MENNLEELIKHANSIPQQYTLESQDIEDLDKSGFTLISENNTLFVHRSAELSQFSFIITTDPIEKVYFAEIFESIIEDKCTCQTNEACSECGDIKVLFNSVAAVKRNNINELQSFLINVIKTYREKDDLSIDDIDLEEAYELEYEDNISIIKKRVIDTLIPLSIPVGDSIKMPILETINDGSVENEELMQLIVSHLYLMRRDMLDYLNNKLS